jgi:trans-aconitate methyltransferase
VLDGSPAVISKFRKDSPDAGGNRRDVLRDFDSNERFDVVVMGFVLEHVDDPALILSRYRRFLAPNGTLFVAVPNMAAMNRRLGNLAGLLPDLRELSENDVLLGHKRFYSVESMTRDCGTRATGRVASKGSSSNLSPPGSSCR